MVKTNIGYGIVNFESLKAYAERGKRLTFKFDMRGDPICLGDIVKVTTQCNGSEHIVLYSVVNSIVGGLYALQKLGSSYAEKSLDAFMYWRGSIFKEDIEVIAKAAND